MQKQMPHPLPRKLFTFPSFSDTEDLYPTTCDELLLLDTESVTSSTLQPEDVNNYNFLPFHNHIKLISRLSHIPILKTQLLQPHISNSEHNKDTPTVQKAKPSCIPVLKAKKCIPVLKDKKCHLKPTKVLQTPSNLTVPSKQTTKNSQPYLCRRQLQPPNTPTKQENLFYQCHLH